MINRLFITILLLMFSCNVFSESANGKVKGLYVNESGTALVILENKNPGCGSTNGWDYSFSSITEQGKQWVSMFLAARMAKTEIRISHNPHPTSYCSINFVYFYDY